MLAVEHVSKSYGRVTALRNVSFHIPSGALVGLLGSNGAGKSSLLRIIAGYLAPTGGGVRLDGLSYLDDPVQFRRRIGYLPEDTPLYRDMRVKAYLGYRGRLKGLRSRYLRRRRREMLAACGLEPVADRLIGSLSRGFRQRLGLADALLHDPDLLMLDEPTANLDPNQRRQMRELIRGLAGRHTVLLSSHILPDVDSICDHLVILHQGGLAAEGPPATLRRQVGDRRRVRMEVRAPDGAAPDGAALAAHCRLDSAVIDVNPLDDGWHEIRLEKLEDVVIDPREGLFQWAVSNGLQVRELHAPTPRLEDLFATLTHPETIRSAVDDAAGLKPDAGPSQP